LKAIANSQSKRKSAVQLAVCWGPTGAPDDKNVIDIVKIARNALRVALGVKDKKYDPLPCCRGDNLAWELNLPDEPPHGAD